VWIIAPHVNDIRSSSVFDCVYTHILVYTCMRTNVYTCMSVTVNDKRHWEL
jgi:hypothetical protein